ncbi:MAG: TIM barrel protein [Pseudomonadota bacterium]
MNFSANLGFLWTELALADAIRAAKKSGFDAVECHWPFDEPVEEVKAALLETELTMLGLNTRRGDVAAGDTGLAAVPGREAEARAAIDEALDYGLAIGAGAVHVMAGRADGDKARATFLENLDYACTQAPGDMTILIEPLNPHDAPGYFLSTTDAAAELIGDLDHPRLKLMFDCYHVARGEGDVIAKVNALMPIIGHIQFAGVPGRGAPDLGEIAYSAVFAAIRDAGWTAPLGAEYKPGGPTEASLAWMKKLR